jgi:membrane-associated protease RseP (regulator of RpoE activity)
MILNDIVNELIIGVLIFLTSWLIIYIYRNKLKKYGLEVYPFLIMWKRKSREEWFPSISRSKYYRIYEKICIVLGFISMIGGIYLIYSVLINLVSSPATTSLKLQPIIPLITVGIDQLPYLLLSLSISVALHEIFHALSSTSNNVKVKGGGILLLGIFPGAFVEPDEEAFNSAPLNAKAKIISAGIAINLILALIFLPLVLVIPTFSQGILVMKTLENSPAYNASISPQDVILYINNNKVTQPSDISKFVVEGKNNTIVILKQGREIQTVYVYIPSNLSTPWKLGVSTSYYFPTPLNWLVYFSIWMFNINLSLSLLNGAPMIITDGAKLLNEYLKRLGKVGEQLSLSIQVFVLIGLISAVYLSLQSFP